MKKKEEIAAQIELLEKQIKALLAAKLTLPFAKEMNANMVYMKQKELNILYWVLTEEDE